MAEALGLLSGSDLTGFQELCDQHPRHADGLRASIARLQNAGLLKSHSLEALDAIPERLGDFRLLELIGTGGMGVVYLAEQESLHRKVALKILRPENMYFEGSRRRFQREVEAVARLSHKGIVSIYTVGEECGLPFFAMEYVKGLTLAQILRGLGEVPPSELDGKDLLSFQEDASNERFGGSWVEAAVRVVLDLAESLAHAHERGVLHRDIKPSNVMLTPDGQVRLLDFGLAGVADASPLTRTGSQPGSMPYMAPEQVLGMVEQIGASTDVYGLGVTLYELLTLRVPYADTSVHKLGSAIAGGNPPSPKRFHPQLSADLLTVCAKSMDVDPAQRYASAKDLAGDLNNLLAFRPIHARRANWKTRIVRFTKRHPAGAVAILLAGVVAVGGPILMIRGYRQAMEIRHVNRELQAASSVAALRLTQAQEVVELASTVAREMLYAPEHETARQLLREGTMTYYLAALGEDDPDSALTESSLVARQRLARDRRFDGDFGKAEATLRDGLSRLEGLDPGQRPAWFEQRRLMVLHSLAMTQLARGMSAEAKELIDRRMHLTRRLFSPQSKDPEGLRHLSIAHWGLSRYYSFLGAMGDYERELLVSNRFLAERLARIGLSPTREAGLCNARQTHAILLRETGRFDEAWEVLQDTSARLARLVVEHPQVKHSVTEYFRSHAERGLVLRGLGKPAAARPHLEQAVTLGRDLLDTKPWDVNARRTLLNYWCQFAQDHLTSGEIPQARTLCNDAMDWLPELLSAGHELPEFLHTASRVMGLQAELLQATNQVSGALAAVQMACLHASVACDRAPNIARFESTRARYETLLSVLREAEGDAQDGAGDVAGDGTLEDGFR